MWCFGPDNNFRMYVEYVDVGIPFMFYISLKNPYVFIAIVIDVDAVTFIIIVVFVVIIALTIVVLDDFNFSGLYHKGLLMLEICHCIAVLLVHQWRNKQWWDGKLVFYLPLLLLWTLEIGFDCLNVCYATPNIHCTIFTPSRIYVFCYSVFGIRLNRSNRLNQFVQNCIDYITKAWWEWHFRSVEWWWHTAYKNVFNCCWCLLKCSQPILLKTTVISQCIAVYGKHTR